ncbi:YacL family protein [Hyalangium sp.]|uniref:YacL family protein n=1 Tax=Hyalangium sp. TaxID=2028555 RepID=UPI002D5531BC|nr:YacL family protein [Hyalangium sp.]HYH94852.1 YacL family protein [Hyalangium sp.]
MPNVRFTWDQAGHVTALAEPPDDVLADYLAEEVRDNLRLCRRLLDIIRALRLGNHSSWMAEGEAWNINLTKGRAVIESEFSVPGRSRELTLVEFEELVQAWLRFLETTR